MTVGNAGAQPLTFGRAPFLARPFLRAMFVVAQVSSMKTRRSGSSPAGFRTMPRAASRYPAGPVRSHARRPTVPPHHAVWRQDCQSRGRTSEQRSPPKRQNAQPPVGATCRLRRRRQRVLEDQAKGSSSTCMPASFASRQLESELRGFENPPPPRFNQRKNRSSCAAGFKPFRLHGAF